MTPEEAYQEALRRILEAEETGAVELDLSRLEKLNRLPPELDRLASLQSLNISGCWQLTGDLAALTNLTCCRNPGAVWAHSLACALCWTGIKATQLTLRSSLAPRRGCSRTKSCCRASACSSALLPDYAVAWKTGCGARWVAIKAEMCLMRGVHAVLPSELRTYRTLALSDFAHGTIK